jgi:hypothetical protein
MAPLFSSEKGQRGIDKKKVGKRDKSLEKS